jgi:hypothetical protein
MRKIEYEAALFAVVITPEDFKPGVHFVSPMEWPLQLGLLMHPEGHNIAPHRHRTHQERIINSTQEFLLVVSGRVAVDFYNAQGQAFHTEILSAGEALLHAQGGHGFRWLEPSRVLEIKQGPYCGKDEDKQPIAQALDQVSCPEESA